MDKCENCMYVTETVTQLEDNPGISVCHCVVCRYLSVKRLKGEYSLVEGAVDNFCGFGGGML